MRTSQVALPKSRPPISAAMLTAAVLGLVGCADRTPETFEIRFEARVGAQPARCGVAFGNVGKSGSTVELADARFYVSRVTLESADGAQVPLVLDQESPWQHEDVALLDFEDARGRCSDTGTAQTNSVIRGTAPDGDYIGLRFELGVPPALNHLDAPTAPTPLNLNALYWNWRFGYIFSKVEFWNPGVDSVVETEPEPVAPIGDAAAASAEEGGQGVIPLPPPGPTVTYLVHIGSTGCESPAPTVPPSAPCTRPNRVPVALADFDPREDVVAFDLAALVEGIDVTMSVPRPPGCMSAPEDPDCDRIFANLGLDMATGRCRTDCAGQKLVFRAPAGGG